METFSTLVVLIFFAAILVGVAQKIQIPYPIALVFGGMAIGFLPGLEEIPIDPNLILIVVLPPILYYAAFSISSREFKRNLREIFSLALGLVILTTFVIGMIFKWIFPEFPWALAFAFGAIISPPDAIATTTIMKRFPISPRLLAIIEGESLVNDASALVLYKLAVTALLAGAFSFSGASLEFLKIATGGIILGFILGYFLQNFSRRYLEPVVGVLFSFTIPYITYFLADFLGVSGVLAVVMNGLMGARVLAKHHSSHRRVLGFAFWDIFNILVNCLVFILIGLQLKRLISVMTSKQIIIYVAYACLFSLALIAIRLLWVFSKNIFNIVISVKKHGFSRQILGESTIIGWAGMRGIVSLVAALALPYAFSNGMPIEGRNEVIFLTFMVILIMLLLPSCTLGNLIHFMKMNYQEDHHKAHHSRKHLVHVAENRIHHLHTNGKITDKEFHLLANYFTLQRYIFEISTSSLKKMSNLELARIKVFQSQRTELIAMWERQDVDDRLFLQLMHELDVEESHIARAELK